MSKFKTHNNVFCQRFDNLTKTLPQYLKKTRHFVSWSPRYPDMASTLLLLLGLLQFQCVPAIGCLDVDTTSGLVQGFVNDTTPNVAQYLGIPFAEPPVGARRWLPALSLSRRTKLINATRFGPSCPQWETDVDVAPNAYTVDVPNFTPSPLSDQSEDCLLLNIWVPWKGTNTTKDADAPLPVLLWLYGGGYGTGSGSVPYQNPAPWVEKSGKHIVVSIK
jgi:acetylcholinesterase